MFDIRDDDAEQTVVLTSNAAPRTVEALRRRGVKDFTRVVLACTAVWCSTLSQAALADTAGQATTPPAAARKTLGAAASTTPRSAAPTGVTQLGAPTQSGGSAAAPTSKGKNLASQVGSYGDLSADAPCH